LTKIKLLTAGRLLIVQRTR